MNVSLLEEKKLALSQIEQDFHSTEVCQERIILNGIIQEFLKLFSIMQIWP